MRHIGTVTGIVEQPIRRIVDPVNGNLLERRWLGRWDNLLTGFTAAVPIMTGARTAEYSQQGSIAEVRAQYGYVKTDDAQKDYLLSYTLEANVIHQSIFKHPNFSIIPMSVVKLIMDEKNSSNDYEQSKKKISLATNPGAVINGQPFIISAAAIDAFNLILAGDEGYEVIQSYTFGMTRTSSHTVRVNYYLEDDGKLFSTVGLTNYLKSWNYEGADVPWAVPDFSASGPNEELQLVSAWKKEGTRVQNIPNGNIQVTEQWKSARWSKLLYYVSSWG